MWIALLAIVVGLVVLVWSADRFVEGAASASRLLGLSPLLIGILVIGFGTSAPEIMVSILAAIEGNPGLALGNAFGSNIANIGLILGIVALLSPLVVDAQAARRELPVLAGVTLLSLWLIMDGQVSRLDAVILLAVLVAYLTFSIIRSRRQDKQAAANASADTSEEIPNLSAGKSAMWTIVGLVLLIASSRLLVWGATTVAEYFGVSDLVIGLTVVAIGTSLPELASSLSAVRQNHPDLVFGNIMGSNLFNTLAVVGIAAIINPIDAGREVLVRDWPIMAAMTLALIVFLLGKRHAPQLGRGHGALLLGGYVSYNAYLLWSVL